MKNFLQKQLEKEKIATMGIGRSFLKILIIFWGIMGIVMLVSPVWPLGLVFIVASGYIYYRIKYITYDPPILKKWSYVIGGLLLILGGLGNFNKEAVK
ncbi:MAG: hypothetical protein Q8N37_02480 [bacterium]|nr:hypothetical protein [bacterium]